MSSHFQKLIDIIETNAKIEPERFLMQVIEADQTLTRLIWRDLIVQSQQFAKQLHQQGIESGERVVIISENHPFALIAIVGCWYQNAIPVPIDASLSSEQWLQRIEWIQASGITISPSLYPKLSNTLLETYPLFNHHKLNIPYPMTLAKRNPKPKDYPPTNVVVILMTTGTSGQAKAVMHSSDTVLKAMENGRRFFQTGNKPHTLNPLPLHHVFPFFGCFINSLIKRTKATTLLEINKNTLMQALDLAQPTHFFGVPPLLELFSKKLQLSLNSKPKIIKYSSYSALKILYLINIRLGVNLGRAIFSFVNQLFSENFYMFVCGGCKLNAETEILLRGLGLPINNSYSQTEIASTFCHIATSKDRARSIKNSQKEFFINNPDKNGQGEICCHSKYVMTGYFREQQATNEVLQDGILHTKDLGQEITPGVINITGRMNDIFVIRTGENISPTEIESLYHNLPHTSELAVFAYAENDVDLEIYAAIVLDNFDMNHEQALQNIQKKANEIALNIPPHFQIKRFHILESLPKASGMKVKRFLLPDLIAKTNDTNEHKTDKQSTISKTELHLQKIWLKTLSLSTPPQSDDNFYQLGGNSILLAEVEAQISNTFNIEKAILITQKMQNNTLTEMSTLVDEHIVACGNHSKAYQEKIQKKQKNKDSFIYSTPLQRFLGGCYQLIILALLPLFWFSTAFPSYLAGKVIAAKLGWNIIWVLAPIGYALWFFTSLLAFVLLKKSFIKQYRGGHYPLYGQYYYRRWTINVAFKLITFNFSPMLTFLSETPLLACWYRLLGAKIGKNCKIDNSNLLDWDLITIGDNCCIAPNSLIETAQINQGLLKLAPLILNNNVNISEQAIVPIASNIQKSCNLQPFEKYNNKNSFNTTDERYYVKKPKCYLLLQWLFGLTFLPALLFLSVYLSYTSVLLTGFSEATMVTLGLFVGVFYYGLIACALKWILLGVLKPKIYPLYGHYSLRKWLIQNTFSAVDPYISITSLSFVYTNWMRACGIRIGKNSKIASTGLNAHGDLLRIGNDCFGSMFYAKTVSFTDKIGYLQQSYITLEDNSFIFLNSRLNPGAKLKKHAGVASMTNIANNEIIKSGYIKSGNECLLAPRDPLKITRPINNNFAWLRAGANRWLFYFILLVFAQVNLSILLKHNFLQLYWIFNWAILYWLTKIFYLGAHIIFNTKLIPIEKRAWHPIIQKQYALAVPLGWMNKAFFLFDLVGTPFYNFYLKCMGMKIGKGTIIETLLISDWNLLTIGKHCFIGSDSYFIGHMHIGDVYGKYVHQTTTIEDSCSVASKCILLPNTHLKSHVNVSSGASSLYKTEFFDVLNDKT